MGEHLAKERKSSLKIYY